MLVETCVNENTMFVPPKDVMFHTHNSETKKKLFQHLKSKTLNQAPLFNHLSTIHSTKLNFTQPPNNLTPKTSPRSQPLRLLLPSNHISPGETNRTRNHSTDQIQRTQNARIPSLDSTMGKISSSKGEDVLDGSLGVRDFGG